MLTLLNTKTRLRGLVGSVFRGYFQTALDFALYCVLAPEEFPHADDRRIWGGYSTKFHAGSCSHCRPTCHTYVKVCSHHIEVSPPKINLTHLLLRDRLNMFVGC